MHQLAKQCFIAWAVLWVVVASCGTETAPVPERPMDVWARRSVLDQEPRMLTLALHPDMYVAYRTNTGLPYKIWKGGVYWDGAPYNGTKTVQPHSWGNTYWSEQEAALTWQLVTPDSVYQNPLVFKGYHLQDQTITLQYEIPQPNQPITITEQPEYIQDENGQPAFRQIFTTKGLQADQVLRYGTQTLTANGKSTVVQAFEALPDPIYEDRPLTDSPGPFWLDRSGCNTCHELDRQTTGPAYTAIAATYTPEDKHVQALVEKVKVGGAGNWGEVVMPPHPHLAEADIERMITYILSLQPSDLPQARRARKAKSNPNEHAQPGFGLALEGVHPSLDIQTIRPTGFQPKVGGMDFLTDGTLLIATWDSLGAVYALTHATSGDTSNMQVKRIAAGLHEPLGLKVVDDEIFVMQKPELTQLIDHDGDGITDEYKTICGDFGVTNDFHEYAYGLAYRDGYFYANLGLAMRLMSHETQLPDRGTTIKIDRAGNYEVVLTGLRQPNGIGQGSDGQLYLTENQGQWVPACKVIVLQEGDFHGCQFGTGDRYTGQTAAPPAVWLPQHEIGNSPGQPVVVPRGIYAGQLLYGEVTHGGIKRVALEQVNDVWQGAVFRFSQGLEAGINRLVYGPDGALYAGGVGMNGNWSWRGHQYGLQRLTDNGETAFEILRVQATSDGFDLVFTQPLSTDIEFSKDLITLQQWRYEATSGYGGSKLDLVPLQPTDLKLSVDRTTLQLVVPGRKAGHVVYFLLDNQLTSTSGSPLWSGEAWYTLNQIPDATNHANL